jgi:hypothetical protein
MDNPIVTFFRWTLSINYETHIDQISNRQFIGYSQCLIHNHDTYYAPFNTLIFLKLEQSRQEGVQFLIYSNPIFKSKVDKKAFGRAHSFFLRSVYRNKAVGLCELPQLSSHTVLLFRILALFTDSGGDSWGIVAIIRNIIVDFH